ncbi:UDP-N-acetylglucosamine--dolichyl-phosphate N-acetylglucosaminephosphotransferase-like protein [Dinothrombium tinctorium]|uniref:UDP-N-acetylglucosamine--dolichyl-phosphate N-acetylglucosaminephosphotransferase n=1 Tax=Dinothrombium tinctorium TaxID=1965070 RepID=A0A443R3W7_9ACAR|nr:UDP-N-acetylglucosamine--dolichyl-phosphate N-acetylglucosaminephosphotransferase-like protein [Dinothrombium tinctorium]
MLNEPKKESNTDFSMDQNITNRRIQQWTLVVCSSLVAFAAVFYCKAVKLSIAGKVGLQLSVNTLLAIVAFKICLNVIETVKEAVKAKLFGIDKGRPGKVKVPEALGVVSGAFFLITGFLFIPIPFLTFVDPSSYWLRFQVFDEFLHKHLASMLAALLSICCMLLLGFVDDILDLRWKHKLFLPAIASMPLLIIYFITCNVTTIVLPKPFGYSIDLGAFYYVYILLMAIFCTNAINIYAGINGIEVGQSVIICISIIIFNIIEFNANNWSVHLLSLNFMLPFLAVSCALLYHNWYPAEVFVGDTFCYFAGMTFAVVGIVGHFGKTVILFFIPQVFNFIFSCPQLFHFIPCPRHRLPQYIAKDDKMTCSTFNYRTDSVGFIVLIGNAGVGKTCLVRRFTQGVFPGGQGATIGVDFMIKSLIINGVKVKLQIWDTAGQERFRSITQSYYRSAHCLILVYDISSQPSFDSLPQWCRDVEQYAGNSSRSVLKVLVGNKCDKEREIPIHIAEQFAHNGHFDLFMETSALEAENVEKLFYEIAEILVMRSQSDNPSGVSQNVTRITEESEYKSRSCVSCLYN